MLCILIAGAESGHDGRRCRAQRQGVHAQEEGKSEKTLRRLPGHKMRAAPLFLEC